MANDGFRNRRALITGGLGFIGSHLARHLVDDGAEVTLIDCLRPEYGGNRFNLRDVESQVRVHLSDVRDQPLMEQLVDGQDFVFNLAGQNSHLDSMHDPASDLEMNCRASLSLLEACRRRNPGVTVVYTSTRQVYGRPNVLPVAETHPLHPVDVNGIHKLAVEQYHLLYHHVYGLKSCLLRLTNTFGPHMRIKDARQTFLGLWIRLVLEGRPFEVWGGGQLRDFTYVDDVVEALCLAALHPEAIGQPLNLGGNEVLSLQNVADLLVEQHGGAYQLMDYPLARSPIEVGSYHGNIDRIRNLLGWTPKTSFVDGLARTFSFFKEHLHHYL